MGMRKEAHPMYKQPIDDKLLLLASATSPETMEKNGGPKWPGDVNNIAITNIFCLHDSWRCLLMGGPAQLGPTKEKWVGCLPGVPALNSPASPHPLFFTLFRISGTPHSGCLAVVCKDTRMPKAAPYWNERELYRLNKCVPAGICDMDMSLSSVVVGRVGVWAHAKWIWTWNK